MMAYVCVVSVLAKSDRCPSVGSRTFVGWTAMLMSEGSGSRAGAPTEHQKAQQTWRFLERPCGDRDKRTGKYVAFSPPSNRFRLVVPVFLVTNGEDNRVRAFAAVFVLIRITCLAGRRP